MIVAEFKSGVSTIRIHDEHCGDMAEHCISRLSDVVSESYKRRQMEKGAGCIAAMQSNVDVAPKGI